MTNAMPREIKRIYVDTSVVGAIADDKMKRQQTQPFWDAVQNAEIVIIVSDVLVSWNFKHIVNFDRIRGYNSVNIKQGYSPIEIRTLYEVIYAED